MSIMFNKNSYKDYATIKIADLGSTIKIDLDPADPNGAPNGEEGVMKLMRNDGMTTTWNAMQFHFHAPSENSINGKLMDLEMHVVHLSPTGELGAVLGIMFDRNMGGNANNLMLNQFSPLWASATKTGSGKLDFNGFVDTLNLNDFWSFDGSLTTPPCTEGVKWTVLK